MIRLLWFSPLPPARTDIANYTARIAPHLAHLSDFEQVDPQMSWPPGGFCENLSRLARKLNDADVCVYNIGNNVRFHGNILGLSLAHPGVIVLHDRAINELVLGHSRAVEHQGVGGSQVYQRSMAEWYGSSGIRAAQRVMQGLQRPEEIAPVFPLYELALARALGAVCHNPEVASEVAARFPRLPVLTLPLPYPTGREPRQRSRGEGNNPQIRLCAFGFLGHNRRIAEFMAVWGRLPNKARFVLDLAGEIEDVGGLMALADELGLTNAVRWHGFLPDDDLDDLIAASDLVLNLRYPSMGEASGSQLRIWANGAASAVSNTGWYAQLPDDCVIKIRPEAEAEADDLARVLHALTEDMISLSTIADRGRAVLRGHDPGCYAKALVGWLEQERAEMVAAWSESALLSSVARVVAECTPPQAGVRLPPLLVPGG